MSLRKVIKNRCQFPNDMAILKPLYLGLINYPKSGIDPFRTGNKPSINLQLESKVAFLVRGDLASGRIGHAICLEKIWHVSTLITFFL